MFHSFRRFILPLALCLLFVGGIAHAAPLIYSTATTVSVSSPATSFTIAAGSVADSFTVNATSVVVTLSSSTGGTFGITSPSYDLTIASSSGGGTVSTSCTSGVASTTIAQSTGQASYTITPTASQCTTPQNQNGNNGGGGGSFTVASAYGLPYIPGVGLIATTTAPSSTAATPTASSSVATSTGTSTASLEAQLQSLLAELATLKAESNQGTAASAGTQPLFKTALYLGTSGPDVRRLQAFLAEDPALYSEGKVTGYFGALTLKAVERFQKKYGLAKSGDRAYGYVGPATRAKLNVLIKEGVSP